MAGLFNLSTVHRLHGSGIHGIGLALASALLAGYQSAGEERVGWVHAIGFASIIAFTVYVILDIEYPRLGWVRIDAIDQVLVSVRAGMN